MSPAQRNPYIGPRTFKRDEGHLFFGREREARDLIALVASEQLVLFYAQSGAGKSSIVNTRLIPNLEKKDYEVLPVGRVGGDLPAGNEVDNVYIYNLIHGLVHHKTNPKILSRLSLAQFLAGLNMDDKGYFYDNSPLEELAELDGEGTTTMRRALIIDQFEELLSTHPEAWEKREDFFIQLAQAMQDDPYLWVVIVMREDYIAALDPYVHHLPGGLRVRYYMQRLSREAALIAMKSPVENLRPYAEGVAEKLVENLASIKVQKPGGKQEIQPGQYVEPVQLQVVCYGLWENLSSDGTQITEKDLQEVGDVNQSLERYYNGRVSAVAKDRNVPERLIREWFEKELITSGGIRNMVLRDQNKTDGLADEVIQTLQGDLVRAEMRAGQMWYELSHDRLIDPVRNSNKKWFEQNLSLFQRQVVLWMQQARSDSLLLRGSELQAAEAEAETLTLTNDEQAYLDACRVLRRREQRDQLQRRSIFAALIVSVLLLVVAGFSYVQAVAASAQAKEAQNSADQARIAAETAKVAALASEAEALNQKKIAEDQAEKALAGSLAAQAESIKDTDQALALLLGIEAYQREQSLLTRTTLFHLLQFSPYKRVFGFDGAVSSVAVSPDGTRIAIASCNVNDNNECKLGEITLFNGKLEEPQEIPGDYGIVYSMAFYKYDDKLVLAAGGCAPEDCKVAQGRITIWEITNENTVELTKVKGHTNLVKTIAFSPDGKLLASGSYDTTILLWDVSNLASPKRVGRALDHESFVNSISFSPDGNILASAGDDRTINLWDIKNIENIPQQSTFKKHSGPVNSIAFGPKALGPSCTDGYVLATSGSDNLVYLWDWCPGNFSLNNHFTFPEGQSGALRGHTGYVKSVSFNIDGTVLASAGLDNKIILWDTSTGEQIGSPLSIHTKAINNIAFGSILSNGINRSYLISVSNDQTAVLWDLFARNPLSRSLNFPDLEKWELIPGDDPFATIDNQRLEIVNSGQIVTLYEGADISKRIEYLKLDDFDSLIAEMYFDGEHLITKDKNGTLVQWIINPKDWVKKACAAVKRNLTPEEWVDYNLPEPYKKTCEDYP